ncbi:MAG: winged helix-turn-helix transcriptional regulator [Candidatus Helarchaeota archaeon]|nr:winged helix-turn-helix transcriptional regulator [Candidatus Helarchaeota archaeon]
MKRRSKKAIKRIMLCLSISMLTGLFLNIAFNNNLSFGCHDLSFQGIGGTSLVIFGIGLNKFSDFFTPTNQRTELEQNTRSRIYNLILEDEGIHLREVCRKLNKKMGVIQYHINVLEKAGLINSLKDGRYRRFFVNNNHNIDSKRNLIISVLKRKPSFKILQTLIEKEKVYHNDLANLLQISSQAITWHIKRLQAYELIDFEKDGKQKVYYIRQDVLPLLKSVLENVKLSVSGSSAPFTETPTGI